VEKGSEKIRGMNKLAIHGCDKQFVTFGKKEKRSEKKSLGSAGRNVLKIIAATIKKLSLSSWWLRARDDLIKKKPKSKRRPTVFRACKCITK
jgi:hypothetical protein